MSVFIGSKLEAQPLQRCFLPLPEVSAVWSWRPIQTPLTARSSFLLGQWAPPKLLRSHLIEEDAIKCFVLIYEMMSGKNRDRLYLRSYKIDLIVTLLLSTNSLSYSIYLRCLYHCLTFSSQSQTFSTICTEKTGKTLMNLLTF